MMDNSEPIYELALHESAKVGWDIYAIRVPGGWLYQTWNSEKDVSVSITFVPFNNEFQSNEQD